jgi:hypothetical protein
MPRPRASAIIMALVVACGARAADERIVQYADNALTVQLTKAPLADVLDEIVHQAGAELRGAPRNAGDVTVAFEHAPLQDGLHRLLGDQNFMRVYASDGHLRAVRLLGGPVADRAPGVPPAHAQPAPSDLQSLVTTHGPVPVTGPLQDAVGGATAGLPTLLHIAVHHDDPTVRSAAVRALVSTMETEPAMRAAVLDRLNSTDDTQLSTMLRGAAGDRAEEVAMQVLTQAHAAEIRVKFSSVLQRLRAGS